MDLKLDADGDLDLSTGTPVLVDGVEAIAQQVRIRLRMFLAEWFLDRRVGVPYYQTIFVKPFRENLIDAIYKQAITTTPGILSLRSFVRTFNASTRELSIAFVADTVAGPLDYSEPFIVSVT